MNSLQYQEILEENVMESVTNLRLGRRWTFQQDNDPKHTSKSTRAWLNMKGWNILEWPSQSPDLNPIENLWWDLKKAVAVRKPKNVTELEAFAHEEWAKIPIGHAKQVPLLTPAHVQVHMKFVNDHLDDPEEAWEKDMWSDETKIELFGINSTRHVWNKKKEEYNLKNTVTTVKHGGGTSYFGGAFFPRGRTTAPY
ncbi:hypothetical protein NFI96_012829 [Prochilodus magdalenae]|nr:hypothetical protein NFI96_012829 [Prochilodus magdalenae]